MLKINLLPPYIYQKRRVLQVAVLFGILFIVLGALMLSWSAKKNAEIVALQAQADQLETQAAEVTALQAQATAEKSKSPTLQAKVQFMEDLQKYNLEVPKLYEEVAKYTYNRVVYNSMQLNGGSIQMSAHAATLGDCGRFLLNMYRASHLFTSVSINPSIPGWPPGVNSIATGGGLDFTVNCGLVKTITAPSYNSGGGAAVAATGPSAAGMSAMGAAGVSLPGGGPPAMGGAGGGASVPGGPPTRARRAGGKGAATARVHRERIK